MINRFLLLISFLMFARIIWGQSEVKYLLSPQQVSDLRNSLHKTIDDTTKVNVLLRLAKYYFEQRNGNNSFLDSASIFLTDAKDINKRKLSGSYDGLIFLYEATLARRKNDPGTARHLLNTAITHFQTANDGLHLAEAYLELSRCYSTNDLQIKNVFDTLFEQVPKTITKKIQDSCMSMLSHFYSLQMGNDSYPVKIDFLDHLVRACRMFNNKTYEFWARKEIADIHYQQGQFDISIKELLQIAKEQKEGGYERICFTYDLLSGVYFDLSNYTKALYYALETIKNVRTALDSSYLSFFYARVALTYRQTGSLAESVAWTTKSLNYLQENKDLSKFYSLLFEFANGMISLNRSSEAITLISSKSKIIPPKTNIEKTEMLLALGMCYQALHKYEAAETYADELIGLYELQIKQKEITGYPALHQFLAELYLEIGQYNKAEKYLNKTLEEWPKSGFSGRIGYQHYFLYKLDSARGNYRSAFNHLREYQKLKDSVITASKTKQIEELKITYATEQKDSIINLSERNILLLRQQDQLQKSKLRQGSVLRNISFTAVMLLIIVISLLYNRYRVKQKTHRKLELQQAEIEKQNLSLQRLVSEKDWLLKEIHHRVKNNLQIVMSLLNSQSAFIDNQPALSAIHDSQHRVHAMSLIHQKLYNSENFSSIDISFYIRELASYLRDSFSTGQRIHFEFDIEPLQMDVSEAVPLGLILNEAITNSIKYAFPNDRNGVISISLSATNLNKYLLVIADNGIGISPGFNFSYKNAGSLGMSLMAGLSADLDGNFSIENKDGTTITISFVHHPVVQPHDSLVSSEVLNN